MANRRFLVGLNGNNYINIGTHSFTDTDNEIECIYALDENSKIWYRASRNNWQEYPQSTKNYRYKVRYGVLPGRFCFFFANYKEDETERLGTGLNLLLFSDIPVTQSITGDFFEDVTTYEEGLYIHEGETRGISLYFTYMPQPTAQDRWAEFYAINNTYADLPEYKYGGMPLPGNITYTQGMTEHEFTFTINKPIFSNIADVKKYIETGEIGASCINAEQVSPEENSIRPGYDYYITNVVKKNGNTFFYENVLFNIPANAKIYLYRNGNEQDLTLNCNKSPIKYKRGNDSAFTTAQTIPDELKYYYSNKSWSDLTNGDFYSSHIYTNIPIFGNATKGEEYADGMIDENESENNGGGGVEHPSDIGEPLNNNSVNTNTCDYVGFNVWSFTKSRLQYIFEQFIYNNNDSLIDEIKSGLWLWNSDPIKCITNMFYLPFDIENFYNTEMKIFKIGGYTPKDEYGAEFGELHVTPDSNNLKTVTLFNTVFTPIYNDFRDYDGHIKYELFLPFRGFVELDVNKYLNKLVKCEMLFDVINHEIRYYLYVNGCITDRFDCSVGIEMPLISDAKTERVNDLMGGINSATNSGLSLALSRTPSEKISSGVGIVSSSLDVLKSVYEKPSVNISGAYSSGLNTYDVRFCYLRITTNQTIKPSNLHNEYNYSSYYIGKLSALSGYCELADVHLDSTATENEINEIKNLLAKGVIF